MCSVDPGNKPRKRKASFKEKKGFNTAEKQRDLRVVVKGNRRSPL